MKLLIKQVIKPEQVEPGKLYLDCERAAYFYSNGHQIIWIDPIDADILFGEDEPAIAVFTLEDYNG